MNNNDQTDAFQFDLYTLIHRYQQEYDLNDQTIAGCLSFAKLTVMTESSILFNAEDLEEDDDDFLSPNF